MLHRRSEAVSQASAPAEDAACDGPNAEAPGLAGVRRGLLAGLELDAAGRPRAGRERRDELVLLVRPLGLDGQLVRVEWPGDVVREMRWTGICRSSVELGHGDVLRLFDG